VVRTICRGPEDIGRAAALQGAYYGPQGPGDLARCARRKTVRAGPGQPGAAVPSAHRHGRVWQAGVGQLGRALAAALGTAPSCWQARCRTNRNVFAGQGLSLFPLRRRNSRWTAPARLGGAVQAYRAAFYLLAEAFDDDPFTISPGADGTGKTCWPTARCPERRPASADSADRAGTPLPRVLIRYFTLLGRGALASPPPTGAAPC